MDRQIYRYTDRQIDMDRHTGIQTDRLTWIDRYIDIQTDRYTDVTIALKLRPMKKKIKNRIIYVNW